MAQFIAILILSGIAGTAYNLWLESASREKHLAWTDSRYKGFDILGSKPGAGTAPAGSQTPAAGQGATSQPPAKVSAVEPTDVPGAAAEPVKPEPAAPAVATEAATAPPAGADAEFRMIDLDVATEAYRDGIVFLDARRSRDYELGHIPGAKPMSAHEGDLLEKIARLRDEQPLESKDCEDSKIVGRQLKEVGFLDVWIYLGGFPEWEKEKRPVARGKDEGTREEA
jgi:rhodanese-related sulfurtransferase